MSSLGVDLWFCRALVGLAAERRDGLLVNLSLQDKAGWGHNDSGQTVIRYVLLSERK